MFEYDLNMCALLPTNTNSLSLYISLVHTLSRMRTHIHPLILLLYLVATRAGGSVPGRRGRGNWQLGQGDAVAYSTVSDRHNT